MLLICCISTRVALKELRMGAKSAWPDLWDIAHAERAPADARATLLVMHAELFASAPVRDRETIENFEAIALGFLPLVELQTLTTIARLLAPGIDTPAAVLEYLTRRSPETRGVVVALAPRLPEGAIDLLLGSAADRVALAVRRDLDARTLERLLVVQEGPVDEALARNPGLVPNDPAFAELIDRARRSPALARALLGRGDLTAGDEAALYLSADQDTRATIRGRIAASALFQRPHLPARPDPAEIEDLLASAARGNVAAFEARLSARLGLPSGTEWGTVEDRRHELLALGLLAFGLGEDDATRVFLTLHPAVSHSVAKVFGLVRTLREVTRPVSLALVEAILGETAAVDRSGRHQPAMSPSGTPARAPFAASDRARETMPDRHRRVS
jgi:hypothetical protein